MIQLNLLPDIKKDAIKAQQTKAMVISVAIIATIIEIGISVLLFVYVTFVQQLQINLLNGDIKDKTSELKAIPDIGKYLTIQNQLAALPQLHAEKGAVSRLLNFLPVLNPNAPNNIALNNLDVNTTDKTMLLSGTAGSFQAMNVFVDTLRNTKASLQGANSAAPHQVAMFKNVALQSGALGRGDNNREIVTFQVQVTYNPDIFDTQNSNVQAVVPSIKTTQSVTDSPQVQLFDQQQKPEGKQ